MSVLPITLHQGSMAHRAYLVLPWLVVVAAIVYVPFATDVGFTPGSIGKVMRIGQINNAIAIAVAVLGLNLVIGFSGQLSLGQSAFVGSGRLHHRDPGRRPSLELPRDPSGLGWRLLHRRPHRRCTGDASEGHVSGGGHAVGGLRVPTVGAEVRVADRWGERQGSESNRGEVAATIVDAVRRCGQAGGTAVGVLHLDRRRRGDVLARRATSSTAVRVARSSPCATTRRAPSRWA